MGALAMRLRDRVAVITGAASGIGRATAELFATEGARVALVDVDAAGLAAVERTIRGGGGTARALPADVSDEAATAAAAAAVLEEWHAVDVLVTCAGISAGGGTVDTSVATWDRVFAVNVRGTFLWVRAVLPAMIACRRGAIVTVASQLALAGAGSNPSYVAAKGAVVSFTRTVAVEHAADGVRANVVVPGAIETPLLARSFARAADPEAARAARRARHPMARFGAPAEVAWAALYLASDEASFTTGCLLPVDGGWLAG